ncbi:ankyrin, partial [Glonium stellatum]
IYLRDRYGNTLLHLLAGQGKTDLMKLLLKAGANVFEPNVSGFTPLHFAAGRGFTDAVQLLIDKGADVSANYIGDPERDFWDTNPSSQGVDTPLHYAATNGHVGVLGLLVKAGADVDAPNQRGYTAASDASITSGMAEVLKHLLELGA